MQPLQLFDVVKIREKDDDDWLVIGIELQDNFREIVPKKPLDRSKIETRLVVRLASLNGKIKINRYLEAVCKVTGGLEVALTHEDENIRKSCKLWLETTKKREVEK